MSRVWSTGPPRARPLKCRTAGMRKQQSWISWEDYVLHAHTRALHASRNSRSAQLLSVSPSRQTRFLALSPLATDEPVLQNHYSLLPIIDSRFSSFCCVLLPVTQSHFCCCCCAQYRIDIISQYGVHSFLGQSEINITKIEAQQGMCGVSARKVVTP